MSRERNSSTRMHVRMEGHKNFLVNTNNNNFIFVFEIMD